MFEFTEMTASPMLPAQSSAALTSAFPIPRERSALSTTKPLISANGPIRRPKNIRAHPTHNFALRLHRNESAILRRSLHGIQSLPNFCSGTRVAQLFCEAAIAFASVGRAGRTRQAMVSVADTISKSSLGIEFVSTNHSRSGVVAVQSENRGFPSTTSTSNFGLSPLRHLRVRWRVRYRSGPPSGLSLRSSGRGMHTNSVSSVSLVARTTP